MKEILRLKEMLEKENIPFEFTDYKEMEGCHIAYPKYDETKKGVIKCDISVIQHKYSYGNDVNLLEMWEMSKDDVEGYLSAEDVFERIKNHYEASYQQVTSKLQAVKDGGIDG